MADGFDLEIDTRQLDRALAELPMKLQKAMLSGALQAAGDVMLAAVQEHTPERTDEPTPGSDALPPGILKADMHTEIQFSRAQGVARIKVGPSALIGGPVARWINAGWILTTPSGRTVRHMPGKHFLEAAFDESAEPAIDVFLERLGQSLGFGENAVPEGDSHDVEFG